MFDGDRSLWTIDNDDTQTKISIHFLTLATNSFFYPLNLTITYSTTTTTIILSLIFFSNIYRLTTTDHTNFFRIYYVLSETPFLHYNYLQPLLLHLFTTLLYHNYHFLLPPLPTLLSLSLSIYLFLRLNEWMKIAKKYASLSHAHILSVSCLDWMNQHSKCHIFHQKALYFYSFIFSFIFIYI